MYFIQLPISLEKLLDVKLAKRSPGDSHVYLTLVSDAAIEIEDVIFELKRTVDKAASLLLKERVI
jgi:hypothetical protein